jgi:hypothetical protein
VFTAKGNPVHALKVCQVISLTLRRILNPILVFEMENWFLDIMSGMPHPRPGVTISVPSVEYLKSVVPSGPHSGLNAQPRRGVDGSLLLYGQKDKCLLPRRLSTCLSRQVKCTLAPAG